MFDTYLQKSGGRKCELKEKQHAANHRRRHIFKFKDRVRVLMRNMRRMYKRTSPSTTVVPHSRINNAAVWKLKDL